MKGTRERGNEGTRERGKEGTREGGNEGRRERGKEGRREERRGKAKACARMDGQVEVPAAYLWNDAV
jgi:hypothetical protein